jgi:hypothetical protein
VAARNAIASNIAKLPEFFGSQLLGRAAFLLGFSFRCQFAQQNPSDHSGLQSSAVCSLADRAIS